MRLLTTWLPPMPSLTGQQQVDFQSELNERNRLLAPIGMAACVAHVANIVLMWPFGTRPGGVSEAEWLWRIGQASLSAAAIVVLLTLTSSMLALPRRYTRTITVLIASYSMVHGAMVAGVDQLTTPTISIFLSYSLLLSLIIALPPLDAVGVYLLGAIAFSAAIVGAQDDPAMRTTLLWQGLSGLGIGALLSTMTYRGRAHEFHQRETIERQQEVLHNLTQTLEQRVLEQTEELRTRNTEVEHLNAHLRSQILRRTKALSRVVNAQSEQQEGAPHPRLGSTIGDRFELVRRLGRGGMGDVYEAVDNDTNTLVALKFVRTDQAVPPDELQRFVREAELMAQLHHPAIVRMLQIETTVTGSLYQVQELVAGQPLSRVFKTHGTLPPVVVIRLLHTLATALEAAHARGIVHRDIKPSNIMLTPAHPGLKLLDFGIAKLTKHQQEVEPSVTSTNDAVTETGMVVGTPGFIAPELRVGMAVTPRSDIYAVGVVGYLALAGETPRLGLPPVVEQAPSAELDTLLALLDDCMTIDPERRPTTQQVVARLQQLQDQDEGVGLAAWIRTLDLTATPTA